METILLPQNKLVQDSEGNEKNRYPIPEPKESNEVHKNILKEEILQEITENCQRCYKTYRRHSRNSKTTKIKNMKRHKNK
jgi:hypothetical protein